jgi:hypothetical protein
MANSPVLRSGAICLPDDGVGVTRQSGGHLREILCRFVIELEQVDEKVEQSGLLLVDGMTRWRARLIYEAGIDSLQKLGQADPARIGRLLRKRLSSWQDVSSKQLVDGAKLQYRYQLAAVAAASVQSVQINRSLDSGEAGDTGVVWV